MNMNSSSLAITMFLSAVITAVLVYWLSKGKVANRSVTAAFGLIGGFFQPIGLIIIIVLVLKKPLVEES